MQVQTMLELGKVVANAFVIWLVVMGYWPMTDVQQTVTLSFLMALINFGGAVFQLQWQKANTTSVVKPQDLDGTPLVRADTRGPTRAAQMKAPEVKS